MKKKMLTVVAAAAVAALSLTGCSGGGSGGGGDNGKASTDPAELQADISYGYWDENQRAAMDALIADFNKTYPNVKVTPQVTPYANYFTKLQTQGESKTLPDVFWMNGPNFQLYADAGLLAPINDTIDPGNYPDALNELYSYDGVQYGAPKDFDTVGVYYNKALFDEAGVDYPEAGWTWDEFHTAAKAISDKLKGDGVYGVAAGLAGGQEMYYNTILSAGGSIISDDGTASGYDSPESIVGLQAVVDLIADGSMPSPGQLSDTGPDQWFVNSKAAMFWSGTWSNAQLLDSPVKDQVGLVELPVIERPATVIHGLANVVAADSKNLEAAQAFRDYLAGEEAAVTQAEMGAANPAFNGTQDAFVATAPWDLNVFLDEADTSSFPYPISKHTAAWNKFENDILPDVFSGKISAEDGAAQLAEQMNEALAAE